MSANTFNQLLVQAWPQFLLLFAAFFTLLVGMIREGFGHKLSTLWAAAAYFIAALGFFAQAFSGSSATLDFFLLDPFGNFISGLLCVIGLIVVLSSSTYWSKQEEVLAEIFPLLLFSSLGMTLMVSTTHLLTLVLALELMSLALYALVGARRQDPKSSEAAIKYFITGSVAAAFLLLGVSFLYGATGTLDLLAMAKNTIPAKHALIFQAGIVLVILGFVFKIAAVPLHFWAPDVYSGAPAPITGFMATGVKIAAFAVMIRILLGVISWEAIPLRKILLSLSLITMMVGNLTALRQTSIKRILAYSSIAHAGYLLLGLATLINGHELRLASLTPLIYYFITYALLTLGVFAGISALSAKNGEITNLEDFKGLAGQNPGLAAAISIFLISLAGIPPTAGFFAKYYLFSQAIALGYLSTAVVGIITSAISLFYYLAPVVKMYFAEPKQAETLPVLDLGMKALLLCLVLGVFYFGLFPSKPLKMISNLKIQIHATSNVHVSR